MVSDTIASCIPLTPVVLQNVLVTGLDVENLLTLVGVKSSCPQRKRAAQWYHDRVRRGSKVERLEEQSTSTARGPSFREETILRV